MNLYNIYILPIQINMWKLQLEKKNVGAREILKKDHWWIYIYKFWNFDNRFLVGVRFKFLKLRYMLHVLLKHLLILYLKEIDKNK